MTLLNYLLADDAVYVMTDTVISDPDDLVPVGFTTKVYPLPHLQALICGTGHVQPIVEWVAHINLHLLVRDIVQLDPIAPSSLRALFGRCALQQAGEHEVTTTLYHFGFDSAARRFAGFAYRSVDHFESEPLEPGFGFAPAPEWPLDASQLKKLPDDFIALAKKQKAQDDATKLTKRVGVGGQLIFHAMQRVPGPRRTTTDLRRHLPHLPRFRSYVCRSCRKNVPDIATMGNGTRLHLLCRESRPQIDAAPTSLPRSHESLLCI